MKADNNRCKLKMETIVGFSKLHQHYRPVLVLYQLVANGGRKDLSRISSLLNYSKKCRSM